MRVLTTDRTLFDRRREPIRICAQVVETFVENGLVTILSEDRSATQTALLFAPRLVDCMVVEVREYQETIAAHRAQRSFDILLDTDPALVTWAYSQGIPALLILEPRFMDPRFRPDGPQGVVPWSQLVDEVESQQRLLASKRSKWEQDNDARFE